MHRLLFLTLFYLALEDLSACMNAYQFKIFPVGVAKGKIISIDFQIQRTSAREGMSRYGIEVSHSANDTEELHVLRTFISTFDLKGQKFSTRPIDTSYVVSNSYANELNVAYQRLVEQVLKQYPKLQLLQPEYLSYCAYMDACELVQIDLQSDTIPALLFEGRSHGLFYLTDSTFHGTEGIIEMLHAGHMGIGSVRIYRSRDIELVVAHIAAGNDRSIARFDEDNTLQYDFDSRRESKPDAPFVDISTDTYVESMLHHGFGVDVYVIR